jgi:hypothetical protein
LLADAAVASGDVAVSGWPVYLVAGGFAALCAAGTWALVWVQKKLKAETTVSLKTSIAAEVAHFVELVVRDLEVTLKPKLKLAVGDGVLTTEEVRQLRTEALDRVKFLLATSGLEQLKLAFGFGAEQATSYILGQVEKKVAEMKLLPSPEVRAPLLESTGK